MKADIDTQKSISDQAGPLSEAKALKAVLEQRASTEAAQEKALVEVQEMKALKEEKKYIAEMIIPAEAKKKAAIINAEADQQTKIIAADGMKQATIKEADGNAQAIKLAKLAEAEGEASIIRERGNAEADSIKAKLLAEAEGINEKAEAYAKLDQTGKFLEVLNALQTLAPNMIKEFAGVMAASTAHLSNIKDIKIVDFGGGGKSGSSVGNFGSTPVELLTKFAEGAQGAGFDISKLINFMGINKEETEEVKEIKGDSEFPEVDAKKA